MTRRVLQDIHIQPAEGASESSKRKWEYSDKEGIVKEAQKTSTDAVRISSRPTETAGNGGYSGSSGGAGAAKTGYSKYLWIGVIVVVLMLFFIASSFMGGAKVEIVLLQQTTALSNDTFKAAKDGKDGAVPYQMVVLTSEKTKQVQTTMEEEVVEKASGEITVYNRYSKGPVDLVVNTRFQSPEGLIFRVAKRIVVPGYVEEGGEIIPGKINVTVYADEVGAQYNIGKADFTVPGLRDSFPEMYENIYARSVTNMTGGYDGVLKSAPKEETDIASEELQKSLKDELMARVPDNVGEEYVLFEDAVFVTYDGKVATEATTNDLGDSFVDVTEKATLYAAKFKKSQLSSAIASKSLSSYKGDLVMVRNIDDLSFTFTEKDTFNPTEVDSFAFSLSGDAHIVWHLDEAGIKEALKGVSQDQFTQVIQKYNAIRKAELTLTPFWKRTFPNNVEDIELVEVTE